MAEVQQLDVVLSTTRNQTVRLLKKCMSAMEHGKVLPNLVQISSQFVVGLYKCHGRDKSSRAKWLILNFFFRQLCKFLLTFARKSKQKFGRKKRKWRQKSKDERNWTSGLKDLGNHPFKFDSNQFHSWKEQVRGRMDGWTWLVHTNHAFFCCKNIIGKAIHVCIHKIFWKTPAVTREYCHRWFPT